MRTILHLDMDSFFASVEQQANPKLAGRPIGVIKGLGRTCIIAASKEAKKLGIKTGTSTYEAKAICPGITLVPADFAKYFAVTEKFVEICSRFSSNLEVFSIDELFLEVTESQNFFGGVREVCRKIKAGLKKEVGERITCSIGISYNRLLAKLASGINKPDGVFEITPVNRDEVLFSRKLTDVCGLGFRLEKRLFNLGITNFRNLRQIPIKYLEASLGPFWPTELKKLSYGEDDSCLTRIGEIPRMKSVSRTFTLYKNTTDLDQVRGTLRNLCEEAAFKTRMMGMKGRLVGLAIRGDGFSDYQRQTLNYFIDSGRQFFEIIWKLFKKINWSASVRFLGVYLGDLRPQENLTPSLFFEEQKETKLNLAMDQVNQRFGELTLYPAVLLKGEMIKSEVNGFLGDKSFRLGMKNFPGL